MQSVQRFGVARRGSTETKHHLAAGPTHCGVDYSPVLPPFFLALQQQMKTTKATQQTNTPAHGPEDTFPFPQHRMGPSWTFQMIFITAADFFE